jgi:hypothetical protein
MDRTADRTVGIILTIASVLICGTCSLFFCAAGILAAIFNGKFTFQDLNGNTQILSYTPGVIYLLILIALLLVVVPIVVGVLTLRSRPTPPTTRTGYPPDQPLPPAI